MARVLVAGGKSALTHTLELQALGSGNLAPDQERRISLSRALNAA